MEAEEMEDGQTKRDRRERDAGENAGTDEPVDAAPVVESPCHREQLASVSRGLLRCVVGYAPGREGFATGSRRRRRRSDQ